MIDAPGIYDQNQPTGRHALGRIGKLADDLRFAARQVTNEMRLTTGGDAYEYRGSTNAIEDLRDKITDLEHFLAGWVK
jgi:hypothetical protein